MTKTEICIIVPVYRVEQWLRKCVDSLLAQDLALPYEIILVDDGSPDGCPAICDEYADAYPDRIRVLHTANRGISEARNAGIRVSEAAYICFADSDDYAAPNYLSSLYGALTAVGAEMAVSPYMTETSDAGGVRQELRNLLPYEKDRFTREEALYSFCRADYFGPHSWAKLIRSDIVKAHLFPAGRTYEDCGTVYRWIMECRTVAYAPQSAYYYCQRPDSITHVRAWKDQINQIIMYDGMCDYFRSAGVSRNVQDAAEYRLVFSCYAELYRRCSLPFSEYRKIWEDIEPYFGKRLPDVLAQKQPYMNGLNRFMFRLARHPRLFYSVTRLRKRFGW